MKLYPRTRVVDEENSPPPDAAQSGDTAAK